MTTTPHGTTFKVTAMYAFNALGYCTPTKLRKILTRFRIPEQNIFIWGYKNCQTRSIFALRNF